MHSGPGFRKMVVSGAEALVMKKAYNPGGKRQYSIARINTTLKFQRMDT